MAHFVRCIDGHVFDAATAAVCPACGATVAFVPSADAVSYGTTGAGGVASASLLSRTPLLATVAVVILVLGVAAVFFAWRETRPIPSPTANSTPATSGAANTETNPAAPPP
jgi:hypothetical protein